MGDPVADHNRVVAAADSVDGIADSPDQPLRGWFNQLRKLKQRNPSLKVLWSFDRIDDQGLNRGRHAAPNYRTWR